MQFDLSLRRVTGSHINQRVRILTARTIQLSMIAVQFPQKDNLYACFESILRQCWLVLREKFCGKICFIAMTHLAKMCMRFGSAYDFYGQCFDIGLSGWPLGAHIR